jgi:hypothetical protein
MSRKCRQCDRLNPEEAIFCFYDGVPLSNGTSGGAAGSIDFSTWAFPHPFVFPDGDTCNTFLQLALTCHRRPQDAVEVLHGGFFETFFGTLGRVDLAMAAKAAARLPDNDRALDELLGKLPGSPLAPAKLTIDPEEKNLGVVQVGEDHQFVLTLANEGKRLVLGKATVEDCPWLALGDSGAREKVFQFFEDTTIQVSIVGKRLHSYAKPLEAEITIESNGGNFVLPVQVTVPVKPFMEGVLAGANSPRQLAEKAKQNTKEAAALLENGAVARWYEANGWPYPVQGPTASGLAAVQQFFEVLGLVKIPKVDLRESAITLRGKPGERLEHTLTAMTQEKRAAVAHGVSDQPWLTVGKPIFHGQTAGIPLVIESIPSEPGTTLTAHLKVTANGNQHFDVPVTLVIAGDPVLHLAPPPPPVPAAAPAPGTPPIPVAAATPIIETSGEDAAVAAAVLLPPSIPPPEPSPFAGLGLAPVPTPPPAPSPFGGLGEAPAPAAVPPIPTRPAGWLPRLIPVGIVVVGLCTAVARDALFRVPETEPVPAEVDYEHPVLALRFHDTVLPLDLVPAPTMTFGLGVPDSKDASKFKTKLVYDDYGRTCNVMVQIDKNAGLQYIVGLEQGAWKPPIKEELGKDREGHRLIGARSIWQHAGAPPITVTQIVEIVPGGLSADGKKLLLDTCVVRYDLTNDDTAPHTVALRFLLDTFIGNNDAVPFTIAGAKELCDTMKVFSKPEEVPDYISALERQDLKNPGTVAHLVLRYGQPLEPPSRVTLGSWPARTLRVKPGGETADGEKTRWEVPVLPMALATSIENPNGDSAVTMYWNDREVKPKETRTVGFAYGLGSVTGDGGQGQLGLTAGGELVAEKDFTLTAYVKNPAPGTSATLVLPNGLEVAAGSAENQAVPPIPPGASSPYSPVTWRIQAKTAGVKVVRVTLNSGVKAEHRVVIKKAAEVFK